MAQLLKQTNVPGVSIAVIQDFKVALAVAPGFSRSFNPTSRIALLGEEPWRIHVSGSPFSFIDWRNRRMCGVNFFAALSVSAGVRVLRGVRGCLLHPGPADRPR